MHLRPAPVWFRSMIAGMRGRERKLRLALGLRWRIALAGLWRPVLRRPTFIALTGSCGKTTAKELLAYILAAQGPTACNDGTSNSTWETCRLILRSRPSHKYVVAEMGAGKWGPIEPSAKLFRPDIAIVLTVRLEHYSKFRTLENVAAEKQSLLKHVRPGGTVYLNADDPYVAAMSVPPGVKVVTFGCSPGADVRASEVVSAWPQRLRFKVSSPQGSGIIETQIVGQHMLTPALAAVAVGSGLGHAFEEVAAAARAFPGVPGRMLPVRVPGGVTVIRDEFKSAPHSIAAAFDEIRRASARRKILVFGDMSDTTLSKRDRQRRIAREAVGIFDMLIFVGEHASYGATTAVRCGFTPERARAFTSVFACADFLRKELAGGDLVLLKGTFRDRMTRIVCLLAGSIRCDTRICKRETLCDSCPKLGADGEAASTLRMYPARNADLVRRAR